MQILVSKNKARPTLGDNLVADRPEVRLIRETMEDCWDADAEARLTALCIEERLLELQSNRGNVFFIKNLLFFQTIINEFLEPVPSSGSNSEEQPPRCDNNPQLALRLIQDSFGNDMLTVDNCKTLIKK